MNNTRLLFAFATAALAYMLLTQWQTAHVPVAPVALAASGVLPNSAAPAATAPGELPASSAAPLADVVPTAVQPSMAPNMDAGAPNQQDPQLAEGASVTMDTDVFALTVDLNGADISTARLKTYTVSLSDKTPVALVERNDAHWIKAQSGLIAQVGVAPNHLATYQAPTGTLTLAAGQNVLEVPFSWTDISGVTVRKIYHLERGSFAIGVRYEVVNGSGAPLTLFPYRQLQQGEPAKPDSTFFASPAGLAYVGSVIYSPDERFQKFPSAKFAEAPLKKTFVGGWMALLQHHFFVGWIPEKTESNEYTTAVLPATANTANAYLIRQTAAPQTIAAGATANFPAQLYVGPKLQNSLNALAPGLAKVVDYGHVTFLSEPLFKGLNWLHSVVGNWGWAIILMVLLLKALFYKLSEAQYRSGAKMKAIAPKIAELKKRFEGDTQKFGMAQMELFKKEKVNPLAGCFPILIQIPVFFGLYWVLAESVEMRQAPFLFWIKDLTASDPFFVLPVLNGLVMFLTSKMTPMTGMDPMQQKIMTYMPLMFAVMMAFFPAGLVLYWTFNGLLGLAQQYYITRKIEREAATAKLSR
jgi:YidC/Oxa1 family membrane protein insertase